MSNNNYWITGHNGFIGNNIKKNGIQNKYNLFNISRGYFIEKNHSLKNKIKLNQIDQSIFLEDQNFLIHTAQYYNKIPNSFLEQKKIIEDNFYFGVRLLSLFNKFFFNKILTLQSCIEFDKNNNDNLYAYCKSLFSEFCSLNYESHIKIYLYDTFGLNDKRNKVIDFWIKNFLRNKDINMVSDKTIINITHVDLISSAILKIENIEPKSYILHGGLNISLGDLALLIKKLTNSKSNINNLNKKIQKPFFKYENLADTLKLKYDEAKFKKDLIKIIESY